MLVDSGRRKCLNNDILRICFRVEEVCTSRERSILASKVQILKNTFSYGTKEMIKYSITDAINKAFKNLRTWRLIKP